VIVQKFRELRSTSGLKWNRTFFARIHYFVPSQSIAPHSDSKWNGIGFVCSSDSKPHRMSSCNCYLVGRP